MVNTEDFIKRLEIMLDFYSLNASAFADKIGVQRSSMSHLLSGRNKPSLDFILKILDVFPEVDLYWILNGKGSFPKNDDVAPIEENKQEKIITQDSPTSINKPLMAENLFSQEDQTNKEHKEIPKKEEAQNAVKESLSDELVKIVFFYKNGTFKEFKPN